MVNPGHPSEACIRCKSRKVKCDATKPECTRCTKSGAQCPGYPAKPGLAFRDDTEKTETRAQKIYSALARKRSGETTDASSNDSGGEAAGGLGPSDSQLQAVSSNESLAPATSDTRARSPAPKFEVLDSFLTKPTLLSGSVNSFLTQWSTPGIPILEGTFSFASQLYPSCIPCLAAAIEAVSVWNLSIGNIGDNVDMHESLAKAYGNCLVEIGKAVKGMDSKQKAVEGDEDVNKEEQILLAIEYLTFFETVVQTTGYMARVRHHLLGLLSVIRARGQSQFNTELGRRLFLDGYMLYMAGSMCLPSPVLPPFPSNTCTLLLSHPFTPQVPEYTILPLLQQSIEYRVAALSILPTPPPTPLPSTQSLQDLLTRDAALTKDLNTWYDGVGEERRAERNYAMTLPVNMYRVQNIFVLDMRIRIYQALQAQAQGQAQEPGAMQNQTSYETAISAAVQRVQELVDEICDMMPYASLAADLGPDSRPGSQDRNHSQEQQQQQQKPNPHQPSNSPPASQPFEPPQPPQTTDPIPTPAYQEDGFQPVLDARFSSPPTPIHQATVTNSRLALQHMNLSHPLLVASMVSCLTDTQKDKIAKARLEQARFFGVNRPLRTFAPFLVPLEPEKTQPLEIKMLDLQRSLNMLGG